jgi:hypothetical protein
MKVLLLLLAFSATCIAQQEPCGLRSITESTPLQFPPIARAAHVEGTVIFMVSFKPSGEVQSADVLSGPKLLQSSASIYVQGLRANEYGGPRTCPIVIRYVLQPDGTEPHPVAKADLQHAIVYAAPTAINDPEITIKQRKRF